VKVFGKTDVGKRRANNQDQFVVDRDLQFFAIADGMGGHAAGEVASQIAIETLVERIPANGRTESDETAPQPETRLVEAILEGNRRICESVTTHEERRGMGTTLVTFWHVADNALIGHVGDSRAYRLREGQLDRLTEDHSWVEEQVRRGVLSDEEAHNHPMRNVVTRAMGSAESPEVELNHAEVRPGDLYLLCSDGLNSMVSDEEIRQTLARYADSPEEACGGLIEQANAKGGDDNITVIVIGIEEQDIS